jgi:hypothetical protein
MSRPGNENGERDDSNSLIRAMRENKCANKTNV